jgi:hypothetical protein
VKQNQYGYKIKEKELQGSIVVGKRVQQGVTARPGLRPILKGIRIEKGTKQFMNVSNIEKVPGVETITLTLPKPRKEFTPKPERRIKANFGEFKKALKQTGIEAPKEFRTPFGYSALKRMPPENALEIIRERFNYPKDAMERADVYAKKSYINTLINKRKKGKKKL